MEATQSNRPLFGARLGVVSSAVWQNHDDAGNARGISVSLTKRYFDRKKTTGSRHTYLSRRMRSPRPWLSSPSVQEKLIGTDLQDAE